MVNKVKTIYTCANCDAQFTKWNGRCLECGSWGTLEKETVTQGEQAKKQVLDNVAEAKITNLREVKESNRALDNRLITGISEVDRVLGGGIVRGSLLLLTGEPGIGKSTIMAQITDSIARNNKVIYVSGEESAAQVRDRLLRLNCDISKIDFVGETNTEAIIASVLKEKPALVIIDSIQTVYSSLLDADAGSVNQIRATTVKFLEVAKNNDIAIILAGHITKDGAVAGPKSLEHIVDTVIYLEAEVKNDYRILRATKNRFGSVNEIGIFEMTGQGFQEMKNPSSIFLDSHEGGISGSVVSCLMEGTRPFLVEIQALVSKTVFGYPQRKASGFDANRLQVLCSVISKRSKANLMTQDVILNVVGGMKINEPAMDAAVCLAIISSLADKEIDKKTICIGELGLGGEIRNISKMKERLMEAKKLGFTRAIIPKSNVKISGLEIKQIGSLEGLVGLIKQN
jgi:DNA repair protein RadA/Sms